MKTKQDVINWLEDNRQPFIEMADAIWDKTEIAWHEFFASKLRADFLEQQGFRVQRDIAGMTLHAPRRRLVSTVTGTWMTDDEARDPAFWAGQARASVNFQGALVAGLVNPDHRSRLPIEGVIPVRIFESLDDLGHIAEPHLRSFFRGHKGNVRILAGEITPFGCSE